MIKRKRPRIYPGWWIVVTASFANLWSAGFQVYGFSAVFKDLSAELHISRAVTSAASSVSRIGGGIEAPVTGWLTDRFGPRRVIFIGLTIFSLGLISMYWVKSVWSFYLAWGILVGIGMNTATGMPIMTAITNWFVRKRGIALGARMVLSGVLILPLITWLISILGWRMTLVVGGVVMMVVFLPLTWFFIKDRRPEYYGLLPDGANMKEETNDPEQVINRGVAYAAEVEEVEFTLRQALRTPAYWLLILAQASFGITANPLMTHLIPLLTDMGMSAAAAAAAVTLTGIIGTGSRLLGGVIGDRVSRNQLRFVVAGVYLIQAGGMTLFVLNQTIAMVYPWLIIYFIAFGMSMILTPVIGARYFGRKAFGSTRGTSMIVTMPLTILGPIYLGWAYDTYGSYTNALISLIVLMGLSAALILLARPPKPPAEITDIHKFV
ncbi:MAG: MFS transporter [Chloroflexi bacterium]|nr:MFS transporter [Chloroflexota bacterium]